MFNITNISQFTSPFRTKLITQAYRPWIKKEDRILDIGCGNGTTSNMIKEKFKVNITCCDVKNYLVPDIPFFHISTSGRLPFPSQSFDLAMLNDVLHHVERAVQVRIIKKALRIAKKILIFEAEPTMLGKIFDLILNKLHYGSLETPLTFRKKEE